MPDKKYRWKLFTHWANFLALGGVALAAIAGGGLPLLGLGLLVEGAALWVVPDFPSVQQSFDRAARSALREGRRKFYVESLWDVAGKIPKPGLIFEKPINWEQVLQWATADHSNIGVFLKMLSNVAELKALRVHRPEIVMPEHIERIEDAINVWLQRQYVYRGVQSRLVVFRAQGLEAEFETLSKKLEGATTRSDRIVLGERARMLKQKLDDIPKLEGRLGLAQAEAERIADEIETFLLQVKTSGVGDVSFLDDLVDRYDVLDSDIDRAASAAEVRSTLSGLRSKKSKSGITTTPLGELDS